jgi:alpha-acetolactate decarboxylase
VNAVAVQPEFKFSDISGTLVGFWTPAYARTLSIPGYHLHFLSADHTRGATFSDALVRAWAFNCNVTARCRSPCRKPRILSTETWVAIPEPIWLRRKGGKND